MRLNFNVLWLDDQPNAIVSYSQSLKSKMKQQGFELQVKSANSVAALAGSLLDNVYADEIDLILVDYDLGAGPSANGAKALTEIRATLKFREIIFYSSVSTSELRKQAFEQNVEGVYCTSRGELVETAYEVFEGLIRKMLDLNHVRGIVMGATSEIDYVAHEALLALFAKIEPERSAAVLHKVRSTNTERLETLKAKVAMCQNASFEEIAADFDLVTAYDKLRLIATVLEGRAEDTAKEARKKVTEYMSSVIPTRNLLGHVKSSVVDGARILVGRGGKQITEAQLMELRRRLLADREAFDLLHTALDAMENT